LPGSGIAVEAFPGSRGDCGGGGGCTDVGAGSGGRGGGDGRGGDGGGSTVSGRGGDGGGSTVSGGGGSTGGGDGGGSTGSGRDGSTIGGGAGRGGTHAKSNNECQRTPETVIERIIPIRTRPALQRKRISSHSSVRDSWAKCLAHLSRRCVTLKPDETNHDAFKRTKP
jgi:hypothetical protein